MRVHDWHKRLMDAVAATQYTEFEWGKCDCSLWAADIVESMTGEDYAASFRGKYTTEKEAKAALKKYGKGSLRKSVPLKEKDMTYAGAGDVVMAKLLDGPTIGICLGQYSAFKAKDKGVLYYPTLDCAVAWSID